MSELLPDRSALPESGNAGSNARAPNQPVLSLKDSGTAAFPSAKSHRSSQSKSDCSEDESPHPLSLQQSSFAAPIPSHNASPIAGVGNPAGMAPNNLSGLVSNVHRTTGREPPGLVGASTTIVGDRLFVFGGRRLRPQKLTRSLYVLDLISRHWTKLEASGEIPTPRFFHTVCALGDTKLVCYGGMALAHQPTDSSPPGSQSEATMTVTSDIHVYDIASQSWKAIPTAESPPRRYAHCATILPSSAVFTSSTAPLSALRHNPSSDVPNQGTLGVSIDGRGGAEMIVVGGQDGQSHFIDTIEVFNFRSLKWSTAMDLGKSYGAYRSVVAPLIGFPISRIGKQMSTSPQSQNIEEEIAAETEDEGGKEHVSGAPLLIFSNYNFLNTRVEVQIRHPDGALTEKFPKGTRKPPGLRFPNGGIIDKHLIVSGTYITSSQQEYQIWALDLQTLVWNRVEAGGDGLGSGSWNRGVLWPKRNTFVVLGSRRRKLNEDYNTRRLNFSNICTVELEAFGLYGNPQRDLPLGVQPSKSSPTTASGADLERKLGDPTSSLPTESLGIAAMGAREICDMDILSIDGDRIPVNSHILRVRWGPYFQQLLREDLTREPDTTDSNTLRSTRSVASSDFSRNRSSILTVTPSINTTISNGTTAVESEVASQRRPSVLSNSTMQSTNTRLSNSTNFSNSTAIKLRHDPTLPTGAHRSRLLYLPHTYLTIRALIHYLYTATLPPLSSPFCTPQILCSLLQIARPYRVAGLLEATIQRLHQVLDARNTAAVFNAAAMAAGGGDALRFAGGLAPIDALALKGAAPSASAQASSSGRATVVRAGATSQQTMIEDDSEDATSSASASTASMSDIEDASRALDETVWEGGLSAVVGLQKRGLRGLMEGRRIREQTKGDETGDGTGAQGVAGASASTDKLAGSSFGLGIG